MTDIIDRRELNSHTDPNIALGILVADYLDRHPGNKRFDISDLVAIMKDDPLFSHAVNSAINTPGCAFHQGSPEDPGPSMRVERQFEVLTEQGFKELLTTPGALSALAVEFALDDLGDQV